MIVIADGAVLRRLQVSCFDAGCVAEEDWALKMA